MPTIVIIIAVFVGVATLVGGVAFFLRGSSGEDVENRLDVLTGAAEPAGRKKNSAPSLLTSPLDDVPGALEKVFSRFLNLRLFLDQADTPLSPPKFLMVCGGLAAVGAIGSIVFRIHFAATPVIAITIGCLPFAWLIFKRKRRLARFGKQLPSALELISRALRAGHSLASGFNLVAEEMDNPIAKEFARCYEEQNYGIPLEEALEDLTDRVPNLDLRFFATAVILQRQTGGDLAEILDKIGHLVRERFKIWGQIQALTGEGRLSGIVLLALPPVLFITMYRLNTEYVMMLFTDPLGNRMLAGAIVMQLIGALVIRKIINIKV